MSKRITMSAHRRVGNVDRIMTARVLLRQARNLLARANAKRARQAVARALKSAEGAERHAVGMLNRAREGK